MHCQTKNSLYIHTPHGQLHDRAIVNTKQILQHADSYFEKEENGKHFTRLQSNRMTLTCELWLSKKNLVVPEAANEVEQFTHCNKPSFARARLDSKKCLLISLVWSKLFQSFVQGQISNPSICTVIEPTTTGTITKSSASPRPKTKTAKPNLFFDYFQTLNVNAFNAQ